MSSETSEQSSEAAGAYRMSQLPPSLEDLAPLTAAFARLAGGSAPAAARGAPEQAEVASRRREASYVVNRRGEQVPVEFDRITARNEELRSDPRYGRELASIDSPTITADVVRRFRNGMTTRELDAETADICIQLATHHYDYESLAARVLVSDLHKRTPASQEEMVAALWRAAPTEAYVRLSEEFAGIVRRAAPALDARLDFSRDYRFRYFGFKTLARSYLIRSACRPSSAGEEPPLTERPQHLYMRIALGLFMCRPDGKGHLAPPQEFAENLALAMQMYDALSLQLVSNASPTILNAGTRHPQMSSCFQNATGDDLPALFEALTTAALCSKWSGGVSIWLHGVRAEGAPIRKTGGRSQGLGPYLRLQNDVQLYVDQGGNRPGAFAMYLSVDHADIFTFLAAGRRKGGEALGRHSAPDVKYALWVPDLFMEALLAQMEAERVAAAGGAPDPTAGDWYLFCPDEDAAPGLHLCWGEEYSQLYRRYVEEKRYSRRVKAGDIIAEAFKNWSQEGTPYVLFKDKINAKSNMRNVAPICSSNLCVSGSTLVLTRTGHREIRSLLGQEIEVWNGAEWSTVTPGQTSEASPLLRVELDSGAHVDCTPEHKFYVKNSYRSGPVETRAQQLRPGDKLEKAAEWPVIAEGRPLAHAYTNGFFTADGHYRSEKRRCSRRATQGETCAKHVGFAAAWPSDGQCRAYCAVHAAHLYGPKKALIDALSLHPISPGKYENRAKDRLTVNLVDDLMAKYEVPLTADLDSRLEWFAGLCDGDGTVVRVGSSMGVQLASVNLDFLLATRLMLQTMGCDPKVIKSADAGVQLIAGKDYQCKALYRLQVTPHDLDRLFGLGLTFYRLTFAGYGTPTRNARRHAKVVRVVPLEGLHPTYCFTEPLRHRGVFNGVLTGQCSEVLIASWSSHDAPKFARFHPDNGRGGEVGVCVIAAVCLESFVRGRAGEAQGSSAAAELTPLTPDRPRETTRVSPGGHDFSEDFDFPGLIAAAGLEARALNRVIDIGYHPTPECRRSCQRHRPIGIGIMGLADVYARLSLDYGSPRAVALAQAIAACVYYGALTASAQLAEKEGPYESFPGSPTASGQLQPDLWVAAGDLRPGWEEAISDATGGLLGLADWAALRAAAARGVRNVYVTAYMPTATTSNIVGQNECFEPFTSNVYTRKTLAGEFLLINRHLQEDLIRSGLWSESLRRALLAHGGSVQGVPGVPPALQRRYRTARELHPSHLVRTVAAMAPFICQSASLNLFLDTPELPKILRFLVEGWRAGLKTGLYYVHTKPSAGTQKTALALPQAEAAFHGAARPVRGGGQLAATGGAPAAQGPAREEAPAPACSRAAREAGGCSSCVL